MTTVGVSEKMGLSTLYFSQLLERLPRSARELGEAHDVSLPGVVFSNCRCYPPTAREFCQLACPMRMLATGRAVRQAQYPRFAVVLACTATQRTFSVSATKHDTQPLQNNRDTESSATFVPFSAKHRESIFKGDGLLPVEGDGL